MRIFVLFFMVVGATARLGAQVATFPMGRGPTVPRVSPTGPNPFAAAAAYTRALWLSRTPAVVLMLDPRELADSGLLVGSTTLHDGDEMRATIVPKLVAVATLAEAVSCHTASQLSACPARMLMTMGHPAIGGDTGSIRINLRSIEPDSTGRCARTANICVTMTDWVYHVKRAKGVWAVVSFDNVDLATTMGVGRGGGNSSIPPK